MSFSFVQVRASGWLEYACSECGGIWTARPNERVEDIDHSGAECLDEKAAAAELKALTEKHPGRSFARSVGRDGGPRWMML